MPTPCRLVHKVGTRVTAFMRCPNNHSRHIPATDADWENGFAAYRASHPATVCPECGSPESLSGMSRPAVYDTEDGELHPGDLYWAPCDPRETGRTPCQYWDNCDGQHLHVVLPNGIRWDIDSRASNCTMKEDRLHRCWIRTGEPPNVTAGKNGFTCSAGAGSILMGDYHGFLRDGVLT